MIAGVDEVGRGPLVGPVVAAAVILDPNQRIDDLDDSKKLSAAKRQRLSDQIKAQALSWNIVFISAEQIDQINILQATFEAMRQSLAGLSPPPKHALIDGNKVPPGLSISAEAVVKGDQLKASISAASIIAKVARDEWCLEYHQRFPQYGFDQHKGYPTALHLERLRQLGPTPQHRRSFKPVAQLSLL